MALASFYNRGTCPIENYIVQRDTAFKNNVRFDNGNFNAPRDKKRAIAECERINQNIRKDVTRYGDEEFRHYPYEMCIGFEESYGKYLLATLIKPRWRPLDLLPDIKNLFSCDLDECSFQPAETNDNSIRGLETTLMTPSFEIKMTYIHGQSSGIEHYKVNGMDFMIKTEWTPRKFKIEMGYGSTWSTIELNEFISIFKIRIEPNGRTIVSEYKLFRGYSPEKHSEKNTFLAPFFENKYVPIRETLDKYVLIKNNAPFSNFEEVEYACDMLLECTGIVQWDDPFKENYFTLYSETRNVEGFEAHQTPTVICSDTGECQFRRVFLKKMSMVYQGAGDDNSKCDTIAKKRSKYPTVEFEEIYDIPIENIDLSLAKDEETSAIIIGSGLWTNCWVKGSSTSKNECYKEARTNGSYGFAFSEDSTEEEEKIPVCLIYHQITDQSKIKLGRYNSEARRTLFHPCNFEDDTYWRPA